ncbi:uncharacterized protein ColSpa_03349 [Colletotrichum spaethianum]|uniref:Uncharacterized protein n=1 Tax=Colletotrichum spaethianum TaxID=700344 RepID=A0AA37L795_9PEZI|nr:uncharacterized protein ColSpa_03349 [Colletotrichum spaethianum]GKT43168.1 hypothetical protein ColSpa_03349 [Colletotrichum spaethianum]
MNGKEGGHKRRTSLSRPRVPIGFGAASGVPSQWMRRLTHEDGIPASFGWFCPARGLSIPRRCGDGGGGGGGGGGDSGDGVRECGREVVGRYLPCVSGGGGYNGAFRAPGLKISVRQTQARGATVIVSFSTGGNHKEDAGLRRDERERAAPWRRHPRDMGQPGHRPPDIMV